MVAVVRQRRGEGRTIECRDWQGNGFRSVLIHSVESFVGRHQESFPWADTRTRLGDFSRIGSAAYMRYSGARIACARLFMNFASSHVRVGEGLAGPQRSHRQILTPFEELEGVTGF